MKKTIFVLLLVFGIFANGMPALSSEIEDSITDEADYSMHAFGEKTSDGMSVYASVEEPLPEKAQMKVSITKLDADKADNGLYEQDKRILNITVVDIGFFNNEEIIRLKDGTMVHFEILMNIEDQETTGDYKIFRLTDKGKYEEIPANETSVKGSFTDLEDNSVKKQFSFDIVSEPAISDSFKFFIIEYEAFTEQNQGETIPEQIVDEPTPEQVEVEPSNEETETEVMPEQEEIEITPEQEETETVPEQNNVDEQGIVEKSSGQNKVEEKPAEKDAEENTAKPDKAETKPEESSKESKSNQDKTEQKQERNETIDIEGKVIWNDNNNQDAIRPTSLSFSLKDSNGKKYPIKVEEDEENKNIWKYSVKGLPKYSSEKELKYSIKKEKVKGYEINIDGYDVEYKHEPEKILIEGIIMWDDLIIKERILHEPVTVKLLADGADKNFMEVSRETKWKYSFEEDKFKEGREIKYSVEENPIDGYEITYYELNIKNTRVKAEIEDDSSETTITENASTETGKKNGIWFGIIMMGFIVIMIVIIIKSEFFK